MDNPYNNSHLLHLIYLNTYLPDIFYMYHYELNLLSYYIFPTHKLYTLFHTYHLTSLLDIPHILQQLVLIFDLTHILYINLNLLYIYPYHTLYNYHLIRRLQLNLYNLLNTLCIYSHLLYLIHQNIYQLGILNTLYLILSLMNNYICLWDNLYNLFFSLPIFLFHKKYNHPLLDMIFYPLHIPNNLLLYLNHLLLNIFLLNNNHNYLTLLFLNNSPLDNHHNILYLDQLNIYLVYIWCKIYYVIYQRNILDYSIRKNRLDFLNIYLFHKSHKNHFLYLFQENIPSNQPMQLSYNNYKN